MRRIRGVRSLITLLMLAAVLAIAAACDGDDDVVDADPTETATEVPTETPTETPSPTPEPFTVTPPSALDSYRYTVLLTLASGAVDTSEAPQDLDLSDLEFQISVEGERINPDREHGTTTANLGFVQLQTESIVVGDQEWTREAGGEWQVVTGANRDELLGSALEISPANVFGENEQFSFQELNEQLEDFDYDTETVNDIETRHYQFDQEDFQRLFENQDLLPEEETPTDVLVDVWFSEEYGTPVALVISATNEAGDEVFRLDMDVFDLNTDEIEIEAPPVAASPTP